MIRADWTLKVGGTLPGYEEKKMPLDGDDRVYFFDYDVTLDQYEDLLRAFRDGDPDGNGKNDTIPYGANNNVWRSFHVLAGAFGVLWGPTTGSGVETANRIVNGELVTMHVDPGTKQLIEMLARWYATGLLDSEFASQDINKGWEKIAAGLVASTAEVVTYAGNPALNTRPPSGFVKDEELGRPGAEVVVLPPFIGPNGDQGAKSYRPFVPSGGYKFIINRKVEDDKAAKILQIIDYGRATEEGFIYFMFGKPDVHFAWEGEAWNSKPLAKDASQIPAGEMAQGSWSVYPPFYTPEFLKYVYAEDLGKFAKAFLSAPRGQSLSYRTHTFDILNETKLPDILRNSGDTLNTLFNEFFFKAITGEIDVNTQWDAYVKEWKANGGQDLLDELAKAPLVSGLRQGKIIY